MFNLKYAFIAALLTLMSFNYLKAQQFYSVDAGTNAAILTLFADSNSGALFAGGEFSNAGNITSHAVAKWDGAVWDSTSNQLLYPPFDQVRAITRFANKIFIGGPFGILDSTGLYISSNLAYWDSSSNSWHNTGANPNSPVTNLVSLNSDLIITGGFDSIGGIYSSKIVRYDGLNFYSFPPLDNLNGGWTILDAIFYNGELYVGGNFDSQLASNMKDIAKWDGTQWQPVSNGLSGFSTNVRTFTIYQGKLIVGGYFKTIWGDPGNCILSWDGNQWSQLGSGTQNSGEVRCMQVYNNELWVGGGFFDAGGVLVSYIAKWDGSQWHNVGATLDNVVTSMQVLGNDLYVGGAFQTLNGDTVNHIFRFNYLTGFDNMQPKKKELYVSPNPANISLTISFNSTYSQHTGIKIFNTLGEQVYFSKEEMSARKFEKEINVQHFRNGIYFLQVNLGEEMLSKKIVVQH